MEGQIPPKSIKAAPLTREAFAPYGDVICSLPTPADTANQGTAKRFNHIGRHVRKTAQITNLRNKANPAQPNLCVFRCAPTPVLPFPMKLLERHKFSSQFFVPMTPNQDGARGYLVIVCLNDPVRDKPDYRTLKAFVASTTEGINYSAGCWHHPMIALERVTDFCVLVYERRELREAPDEDCEEEFLAEECIIEVDGFRGASEL
ncbi:ureidoglycolate hydrolase [Fimicolochytrium jonesii]|uniref:ureidoglycolate hydrolase n=1 Tax=Fimicolochytrium jonesii TaxID=1396493 RepID=UPI0022FDB409|nr:ureidoglycolate hydrolase [Fimicolochytrium jonesii]KAI8826952.1 ureidoglycolate hydrolase [Fimicolochytrium jonesii]